MAEDYDEMCRGALDEFTIDAKFAAEIVSAWNLNSPPSRITNADVRMLRAAGILCNPKPIRLKSSR